MELIIQLVEIFLQFANVVIAPAIIYAVSTYRSTNERNREAFDKVNETLSNINESLAVITHENKACARERAKLSEAVSAHAIAIGKHDVKLKIMEQRKQNQ